MSDWVVRGFIVSVVSGLASGLPGLSWLQAVAILGILPFMVAVLGAFLGALAGLFRR